MDDKSKQPYLVYARQDDCDCSDKLGTLNELSPAEVWSESKRWTGIDFYKTPFRPKT
jgi:hypothetical protein